METVGEHHGGGRGHLRGMKATILKAQPCSKLFMRCLGRIWWVYLEQGLSWLSLDDIPIPQGAVSGQQQVVP